MKKLNTRGFTAIEGLLILAIVAIVGGAGYFVLKSKDSTNKTYETTSQSSTSASTVSTVYKFSELDVQFTLPKTLNGLTHKVEELPDENNRPVEIVYPYDANLTVLAKKCASAAHQKYSKESLNIAALGRGEGTYKAEAFASTTLLKQLSGFYITISYPNGSTCDTDNYLLSQEWLVAINKSQKEFVKAFRTTASEIK